MRLEGQGGRCYSNWTPQGSFLWQGNILMKEEIKLCTYLRQESHKRRNSSKEALGRGVLGMFEAPCLRTSWGRWWQKFLLGSLLQETLSSMPNKGLLTKIASDNLSMWTAVDPAPNGSSYLLIPPSSLLDMCFIKGQSCWNPNSFTGRATTG